MLSVRGTRTLAPSENVMRAARSVGRTAMTSAFPASIKCSSPSPATLPLESSTKNSKRQRIDGDLFDLLGHRVIRNDEIVSRQPANRLTATHHRHVHTHRYNATLERCRLLGGQSRSRD